jgi:Tfp pilus assembly protein PilV
MSKLNNKGITIIEAIVTITVLLMGILVLVRLFPIALQIGRSAEQATIATNLAQAKIEEVFSTDYYNISVGTIETRQRMSSDISNPFYWYEREAIVEYVDGNLNTSVVDLGIKKIIVNTYWKSALLSLDKNVQLTLLISEK